MAENKLNGVDFDCPAGQDWEQHRIETKRAMEQVNQMYGTIARIHSDTRHLTQLPNITAALNSNVQVLEDIRDNLVNKATSQDPRLIKIFLVCLGVFGVSMVALVAYFTRLNMELSPSTGIKFDGQK